MPHPRANTTLSELRQGSSTFKPQETSRIGCDVSESVEFNRLEEQQQLMPRGGASNFLSDVLDEVVNVADAARHVVHADDAA